MLLNLEGMGCKHVQHTCMWGYCLWRTPMIVPSSVHAVTCNHTNKRGKLYCAHSSVHITCRKVVEHVQCGCTLGQDQARWPVLSCSFVWPVPTATLSSKQHSRAYRKPPPCHHSKDQNPHPHTVPSMHACVATMKHIQVMAQSLVHQLKEHARHIAARRAQ